MGKAQNKVQRVARRESGTRKGPCELLEKQTAELSAVDDELGEDSLLGKLCTTIYILHVVLSF